MFDHDGTRRRRGRGRKAHEFNRGRNAVGRSVGRSVYLREDQEREGPDSIGLSLSSVVRTLSITQANFPLAIYPHCAAGGGVNDKAGGRAEKWFASFFVGGLAKIASRQVQTRDAFIDSRILILRARTWQRGQCGQRSPLRNFILTIAGQ